MSSGIFAEYVPKRNTSRHIDSAQTIVNPHEKESPMVVRNLMSDFFASAHISSTVNDAMEKMLVEGLDNLLIVDDRNQLVGRIEESLLMVAAFDDQWRNNPVSLHMERNFITIRPDEPVSQVVEKFLLHRVSEFPVLSEGKLIGVLTRRQLLRSVMGHSDWKTSALRTPASATSVA